MQTPTSMFEQEDSFFIYKNTKRSSFPNYSSIFFFQKLLKIEEQKKNTDVQEHRSSFAKDEIGTSEKEQEPMDFEKGPMSDPILQREEETSQQTLSPFLIKATIIASLGGILFGYDMGVISGALPQLTLVFDLSPNEEEMIVAFLYLGGGFGAALGGYICDKMGRRVGILITDVVFFTGALMLAFAPNLVVVLIGRLIVGFGVAVSGIADVAYLHEIAPKRYRGALVSCNEASISLGFLLAYVAAYVLTKKEFDEIDLGIDETVNGWRYMFGIGGIIALIQFLGMLCMPESPVWLRENGKIEESEKVLARIHGAQNVQEILRSDSYVKDNPEVVTALDETPENKSFCFQIKRYRRQAIIALFLAIAQQFCGQTNVLNFAPEIFKQAGLKQNSSLLSTLLLGVLKFVVTVIVIFRIENIGRRKLLLSGISIISVSLLILTIAFIFEDDETGVIKYPSLAILGALGVVSGYASSFGPLTWLITSELFPTHFRGRALGASTIVTYVCAMLVSYTFLSGQILFGTDWGPYVMYLSVTVLSLFFAFIAIPDTGDMNVDQVNAELNAMWIWKTRAKATEVTDEINDLPNNDRNIV